MNANDLFKAVMQLDLEPIKMKLMHVESGEGWSLDKANAMEKEYRRFRPRPRLPSESMCSGRLHLRRARAFSFHGKRRQDALLSCSSRHRPSVA